MHLFASGGVRTHASMITGLKSVALNHSAIAALNAVSICILKGIWVNCCLETRLILQINQTVIIFYTDQELYATFPEPPNRVYNLQGRKSIFYPIRDSNPQP